MTSLSAAASRGLASPLATAVAAVGAAATLLAFDPNEPGHYPTCPFLATTGLHCPGCGTLRAVHALLHGDVGRAVDLNLVTVVMLPVLGWAWSRWTVARRRGDPAPAPPAWFGYVVAGALTVFWVARNLPPFAWLAP